MNKEFEDLIKHLKLALDNINTNTAKINSELVKWKSEIELEEIKESLKLILKTVTKWFDDYKKTKDILCISLKEYDTVSKESAYILGETSLVDELYTEIIDWIIGNIGREMFIEIKKEKLQK